MFKGFLTKILSVVIFDSLVVSEISNALFLCIFTIEFRILLLKKCLFQYKKLLNFIFLNANFRIGIEILNSTDNSTLKFFVQTGPKTN